MATRKRSSVKRRLLLGAGVAGLVGFAAVYRFALKYRERVGFPTRSAVVGSPADFGLDFDQVEISSGPLTLAGWFVAAEGDHVGPGVVVVHGWESNRSRTFAHVRYLHAAGFHCLVFDVRGHGDSTADGLPMNVPEFADDTIAAVRWLAARAEVSRIGALGHSMGAAGAIGAASREALVEAVVSMSAPADLVWRTRKSIEMAEMHVPGPVADPLAWFTAAMLLAPRHHGLHEASARLAAARYKGPLLLIHGAQDRGVPVEHLDAIASAAEDARGEADPEVETLVLPDFGHRWLYEDEGCRRTVAAFLARSLGDLDPDVAGDRAAGCIVKRPDEPIYGFGALAGKAPPNL